MLGLNTKNVVQMIATDARLYHRDLFVVGILLISSSIVFSKYQSVPIQNAVFGMVAFVVLFCLTLLWSFRFPGPVIVKWAHPFGRHDLFAVACLVFVTTAIYYPLSLIHFDTGTDLSVAFGVDAIWFKPWADINRPLVGVGPFVAMKISPTSLGGFFFVNCFSRFAAAALIYLVILILMPNRKDIGIAASILFILNPAEPSRFNLWSIYYQVELFFFVFSTFLFLFSYHQGSRILLVIACTFLGMTFLQYEHGYPLSVIIPFFLFFLTKRSHLIVWFTAWYGVVAIFSLRLITYLLFEPAPYQRVLFSHWGQSPDTALQWVEMIGDNAFLQLSPLLKMITSIGVLHEYPLEEGIAFGGIAFFTWVLLRGHGMRTHAQAPRILPVVGIIVTLLGVIMYFPLPVTTNVPDYSEHPTMRYQYFAGIGQAFFWASLIAVSTNKFKAAKSRMLILIFAVATLSAGAVAESLSYQKSGGVLNPYYRYETATKVLKAIDHNLPKVLPGDMIFLEIPDEDHSPLGWDYTGFHWSCRLFGIPMTQGRMDEKGDIQTRMFGYSSAQHKPGPKCARTHHFMANEKGDLQFLKTIEEQSSSQLNCPPCVIHPYQRAPGEPLPFLEQPTAPLL